MSTQAEQSEEIPQSQEILFRDDILAQDTPAYQEILRLHEELSDEMVAQLNHDYSIEFLASSVTFEDQSLHEHPRLNQQYHLVACDIANELIRIGSERAIAMHQLTEDQHPTTNQLVSAIHEWADENLHYTFSREIKPRQQSLSREYSSYHHLINLMAETCRCYELLISDPDQHFDQSITTFWKALVIALRAKHTAKGVALADFALILESLDEFGIDPDTHPTVFINIFPSQARREGTLRLYYDARVDFLKLQRERTARYLGMSAEFRHELQRMIVRGTIYNYYDILQLFLGMNDREERSGFLEISTDLGINRNYVARVVERSLITLDTGDASWLSCQIKTHADDRSIQGVSPDVVIPPGEYSRERVGLRESAVVRVVNDILVTVERLKSVLSGEQWRLHFPYRSVPEGRLRLLLSYANSLYVTLLAPSSNTFLEASDTATVLEMDHMDNRLCGMPVPLPREIVLLFPHTPYGLRAREQIGLIQRHLCGTLVSTMTSRPEIPWRNRCVAVDLLEHEEQYRGVLHKIASLLTRYEYHQVAAILNSEFVLPGSRLPQSDTIPPEFPEPDMLPIRVNTLSYVIRYLTWEALCSTALSPVSAEELSRLLWLPLQVGGVGEIDTSFLSDNTKGNRYLDSIRKAFFLSSLNVPSAPHTPERTRIQKILLQALSESKELILTRSILHGIGRGYPQKEILRKLLYPDSNIDEKVIQVAGAVVSQTMRILLRIPDRSLK